jgi:hypothetical protein
MQRTPLTERDYTDPHRITARWISDLYGLWRACPHAGCRRAKACRNDPRDCEPGMALVPPDALAFLEAMEEAHGDRLSYDEMIEVCSEELATLERWRDQVARSMA